MKVIELFYLACARAFYRWALAEIPPTHPDVTWIVIRRRELDARYRRLCG